MLASTQAPHSSERQLRLGLSRPRRDEDMQSLASLMSLKQADVDSLQDFQDSKEERRGSLGPGHALGKAPSIIKTRRRDTNPQPQGQHPSEAGTCPLNHRDAPLRARHALPSQGRVHFTTESGPLHHRYRSTWPQGHPPSITGTRPLHHRTRPLHHKETPPPSQGHALSITGTRPHYHSDTPPPPQGHAHLTTGTGLLHHRDTPTSQKGKVDITTGTRPLHHGDRST